MAGGREASIDVYEAVTSRRAVRGFKDEPVSKEVLARVLSAAAWSPSGSNIRLRRNVYLACLARALPSRPFLAGLDRPSGQGSLFKCAGSRGISRGSRQRLRS